MKTTVQVVVLGVISALFMTDALAAVDLQPAMPGDSQSAMPGDSQSAMSGDCGNAIIAFSAGKADVVINHQGDDYLRLGVAAWGPDWAWTGWKGTARSDQGATVADLSARLSGTDVPVRLKFRAAKPSPQQMTFSYELTAERDTTSTLIAVEVLPGNAFHGRKFVVHAGGKQTTVQCPLQRRGLGSAVERVEMTDAAGRKSTLTFQPPCNIPSDGAARVVLAEGKIRANQPRRVTITLDLPEPVTWYPSINEIPDPPGADQWYQWRGTGHGEGSLIGLEEWIERPAGKQGRIVRRGDALFCGDRPIKLWGLNLCYSACAPDKQLAERRAALYRRYGINAVRLHKFADGPGWAGIQSPDSFVQFNAEALDRMDYQIAQFKQAGIYVKLSAHFGTPKLGPADKQYVPYLEEFGALKGSPPRVTVPHSAVHYSPELQQVHIQQIVNLLKHRNPYTGMTYGEDPAIAFIEIINEQSILFYTSMAPLKASATLRRNVGQRFCQWLKQRYGSHQKLVEAWGNQALDSFASEGITEGAEHLDRGNILPLGNPWYWAPKQLDGSQSFRKRRLLDTLEFLYQLQCEFYDRYVQAVRQAGYKGEIVASNWQAGRAFSHFANLHSDSLVGTIDRHNYFGGKRANASMLDRVGSGLLSTGMQQVDDRPFMLSEWIHVFPSQMGVEGPAIIGAYGMGLQGWDVSFMFQNGDEATFSARLGRQQWDVMAPQILGVFPAVARQVLRDDVRQADRVVTRSVHVPSLFEGKLGFDDQVAQGYDDKELDSTTVPASALAAVRCTVAFTEKFTTTPPLDMTPYAKQGWVVASTGQLRWREASGSARGLFLIDTPATKAVVGFAQGSAFQLGEVTIEPQSPFGAIYLTAREPTGTIATSKELLIVAIGRAQNTGMKYSPDGSMLLAAGEGPIRMEPVKARFTLRRPGTPTVIVLDHDGRPDGRTVPVADGSFVIDAASYKTPYYLLRY